MHAAKSLQSCLTLCDPIDSSPPGSAVPGILQARTRVGCHFLLQCMKVKSETEVSQSCLTLRDPVDCSLPSSSIHGIFQARVLEWGATAFSELAQGHINELILESKLKILTLHSLFQFSSVQFSRSAVSDSLRPHESQHAWPPCPSPTPAVHSDSHPSSQ